MQRIRQWEFKVDSINPNYKVEQEGFGWLNAYVINFSIFYHKAVVFMTVTFSTIATLYS
ncbi:hypothetical protein QFZ72_004486 [Bacillus sp. V2I10]|nr:hypothetical protein [Bacillus sp. V2I10]